MEIEQQPDVARRRSATQEPDSNRVNGDSLFSFSIGNGALDWAKISIHEMRKYLQPESETGFALLRRQWGGNATSAKIVSCELPTNINKDRSVVLGGVCSLFTAESDAIKDKKISFRDLGEFRQWMASWYPRLDQVHDAIGVPPKGAKEARYVVEDSIFARRIAGHTGLVAGDVSKVIRELHESRGEAILGRWLRAGGYKGNVSVVYTSDIEPELTLALRLWERFALPGGIQRKHEDRLKVNLMYTGLWPEVLGIRDSAVVFEPYLHGLETEEFSQLRQWKEDTPYGTGVNRDIGLIGFLPFRLREGFGRRIPVDRMVNYGNWREDQLVRDEDLLYFALNLWPKRVLESDFFVAPDKIRERVRMDLEVLYGGAGDQ